MLHEVLYLYIYMHLYVYVYTSIVNSRNIDAILFTKSKCHLLILSIVPFFRLGKYLFYSITPLPCIFSLWMFISFCLQLESYQCYLSFLFSPIQPWLIFSSDLLSVCFQTRHTRSPSPLHLRTISIVCSTTISFYENLQPSWNRFSVVIPPCICPHFYSVGQMYHSCIISPHAIVPPNMLSWRRTLSASPLVSHFSNYTYFSESPW